MSGNVKGITIAFKGDTTSLDKAIRSVNQETRKLDQELRKVDTALKFNPTNVDLWRQKQQLLTQKINETKDKLDLLKQKQAAMDAAEVDKNSEEYRKLQREIIETESKLQNFEAQQRKIGQVNLRAASEQFKQYGQSLTNAGEAMKGLSMAATAAIAAVGAITVKSGKWADDLNTLSKQYHIGTAELQKYGAAADLVDVDVNTITKTHVKLTKAMSGAEDETGAQAEAFKTLGISVTDANGELRDSDEVWNEVIQALGDVENETERDALAMQLLGKSAAELNPLIEDGGETYKRLSETLEKYDLDFIDQETLDRANEFNDELDTIKAIGLVALQNIGTQLASTLAPALEKVVDWVGKLAQWFTQLSPKTQAIIGGVVGFVAVLSPLLIGLGKVSFAISSIMSLMATVGPAIGGILTTLGPVVLIIGAVVAAGILLYKNWDTIKAKALELKNKVVAAFNNLKTRIVAVWNGIKTAASNAWNSIKNAILTPITNAISNVKTKIANLKESISSAWSNIKDKTSTAFSGIKDKMTGAFDSAKDKISGIIDKIKGFFPLKVGKIFSNLKLPKIKITKGTAPWGIAGKGTAPTIGLDWVSWYAKGGIFDSPSLIGIGEAGPEAVVPLDTLWSKLDNIAAASGNGPIVINVYASDNMSVNELAAAVEQRIIQSQKRRSLAWQ